MSNSENLSRAQRAFAAAREIAREKARSIVWNLDRVRHSGLSYILMYESCPEWSPTLDIAVRLLETAACGAAIDNGQLNWTRGLSDLTTEQIQAGRCAAQQCAETLRMTGDRFVFAYHIPGETSVQFHFGGQSWSSAIAELADAIACDVQSIGSFFEETT